MSPEEILELARATIRQEAAAVAAVAGQLDGRFVEAAQMLLASSGKVLVAGAGTSHAVAMRMAHLLSCCGTPALFIDPGDAQHGLAGAVGPRDVLVALSKGGETAEVNHLARVARARGATVIAITENPASALAGLSHLVLCVRSPAQADPYGMIATASSLVNSALSDALCVVLLGLRGYTREAFGETHPGGAVGRKLSRERREQP